MSENIKKDLESGGIAHEALAEAWKIGSKALSK